MPCLPVFSYVPFVFGESCAESDRFAMRQFIRPFVPVKIALLFVDCQMKDGTVDEFGGAPKMKSAEPAPSIVSPGRSAISSVTLRLPAGTKRTPPFVSEATAFWKEVV